MVWALLAICLLLVVTLLREMTRSEAAESRADATADQSRADTEGGPTA